MKNRDATIAIAIILGLSQGCASQNPRIVSKEKFDAILMVGEYISQFQTDPKNMPILDKELQEFFIEYLKDHKPDKIYSAKHIKKFGNIAMAKLDLETEQYGRRKMWVAFQIDDNHINFVKGGFELPKKFRYRAELGQSADVASTALSLSSGLVEANPIMDSVINSGGIPALAVVKLGTTQYIKNSDLNICFSGVPSLSGMGAGAAAWNVAMLAGIGAGAIVPAVIAGYFIWPNDAETFWECMPPDVIDYVNLIENQS